MIPKVKLLFFPEKGEELMEEGINSFLSNIHATDFIDIKISFKGFRYIVTIIYKYG